MRINSTPINGLVQGLAGVVLAWGMLACAGDGKDGVGNMPSDPPSAASEQPKASPSAAGIIGPGDYEVGRDLKAGKYTCVTKDSDVSGYWARKKNASGDFAAIIANGNVAAGTQAIVEFRKGDFVELQGLNCKPR